jgi:hypothetical protein
VGDDLGVGAGPVRDQLGAQQQLAGVTPLLRRGLGHTLSTPMRSARGIGQLEVLDPHHEDDIVPVILEEPDHHGALA